MAVYTHVKQNELVAFLRAYDVGNLVRFEGIQSGVENTNYLLQTDSEKLILTLFEKRVETADLPFFVGLMDHLGRRSFPVPTPLMQVDGQMIGKLCGRPAALVTFLEGHGNLPPTPQRAHNAGSGLAALHLAASDFKPTRENALGPTGWRSIFERIAPRLDDLDEGLEREIAEELSVLESEWPSNLPVGTIHADYFPDNVFFSGYEEPGPDRLTGIIDFYFACTDFLAYDLAIALGAWALESSAGDEVASAFRQGYEEQRPLSDDEAAALPILLRGAALRFFLTRAHDALHTVENSVVTVKDPMAYFALSRHLRREYGVATA